MALMGTEGFLWYNTIDVGPRDSSNPQASQALS